MASKELQAHLEERLKARTGIPMTFEAMRERMARPVTATPIDISLVAVDAGGTPGEWVVAPGSDPSFVVLYLHGGGYILGSIRRYQELVGRISRATGARGLALEYRLAPEHPFPAALEDSVGAYRWLIAQGLAAGRVILAGDSAGAGLVITTLVALRDAGDPLPAGGVCISPWLDLEADDPSISDAERSGMRESMTKYLAGAAPRNPLVCPLYADLHGLAPLLIQVGAEEAVIDDAQRLTRRARAAGVDVSLEVWPEVTHVWHLHPQFPESERAVARIGEFARGRAGEDVTRPLVRLVAED